MGYRIRYGLRRMRPLQWQERLFLQFVGALVLLVGLRLCGGMELLRPGNGVWDTATREMAQALVSGEGWYVGAVRFCGSIIHGPY